MRGLNLKAFKKVAGDSNHSVMQHSDGHQIKILHKPLSPKMKKDLLALPMADGGEVEPKAKPSGIPGGPGSPAMDSDKVGGDVTGSGDPLYEGAKKAYGKAKEALGFAKGGPVQYYSDGGVSQMPSEEDQIVQDAQAAPVRPEYQQALAQEQANSNPQTDAVYGTPEQRALQDVNKMDANKSAQDAYNAQQQRIMSAAGHGTPAPASSEPPATASSAPPSDNTAAGSPNPQGAIPASPDDVYYKSLQSGISDQITGAQMGAKAAEAQGAAEAAAHKTEIDNLQRAQGIFEKRLKDNLDENDKFIQDVQKTHIDPNQYYGSLDTGKKISTIIGLVLGGLGAGAGGGENVAMKVLQNHIDRDIDAQKANLGIKKSLLEANMQQTHNISEAMNMTRAQITALAAAQVEQAGSQAKGPMAQAAAKKFGGELRAQYGGQLASVAASQAIAHAAKTGDAGALGAGIQEINRWNPEYGKYLQERYVPGIAGIAHTVVTTAVRDELVAKQDLDQTARDLLGYLKKGSSLSVHDRAIAEQKAMALQSKYREGLLNTVYKQGEQPLLDKAVREQPLSFASRILGTEPAKLQEIIDANRRSTNVRLHNLGLPLQQAPQAAPEMRTMNGVQYQKVQGGWARVK